jgi:hypothetical protein
MRSIASANSDYALHDDSIATLTAHTRSDTVAESSKTSLPVVQSKSRSHLLDALPDDVRFWFAGNYLLKGDMTASQMAWHLRAYACISKAHRTEVIGILNRTEYEAVCRASTRKALPVMKRSYGNAESPAGKFAGAVEELVNMHRHVYADYSKNKNDVVSFGFDASSSVALLFNSQHLKSVQIDLSEQSDFYHAGGGWQQDSWPSNRVMKMADEPKRNMGSQAMLKKLNAGLQQLAKHDDNALLVDLICKGQSFTTFLCPLVANLAEHCVAIKGLRSLDLSFCTRTSMGTMEEKNKKKKQVRTSRQKNFVNYVGNIATFLAGNQSLESLNLARNGLTAITIEPLAVALGKNKKLREIDLSGNPIGVVLVADGIGRDGQRYSRAVQTLAEALKNNQSLMEINLAFCDFDDIAANHLHALLKENKTLKLIDLSNNPISPDHPIFSDDRVVFKDEKYSEVTDNSAPGTYLRKDFIIHKRT